MIKIVFPPGSGNSTTHDNWFPALKKDLEGYEAVTATFPDPILARESY